MTRLTTLGLFLVLVPVPGCAARAPSPAISASAPAVASAVAPKAVVPEAPLAPVVAAAPDPPPAPVPDSAPPTPTLVAELAAAGEDQSVSLGPRLHLGADADTGGPGGSYFFRLPRGWVDERTTGGTVFDGLAYPRAPSGDAKIVVTSLGWTVGRANIDAWTASLHVTNATWDDAEDADVAGATGAKVARGHGKLGGDDADLVYVAASLGARGSILIVGAVKTSAPKERAEEMRACVASVTPR